MTLSAKRFSIAAITGLMMLSFTPSSAQAFCLWGYGNSCRSHNSADHGFRPIAGAALGANQDAATGTQPPSGGALPRGNLGARENATALGILGAIAIIAVVNSSGGT